MGRLPTTTRPVRQQRRRRQPRRRKARRRPGPEKAELPSIRPKNRYFIVLIYVLKCGRPVFISSLRGTLPFLALNFWGKINQKISLMTRTLVAFQITAFNFLKIFFNQLYVPQPILLAEVTKTTTEVTRTLIILFNWATESIAALCFYSLLS